jgi:hypothetical protein
MSASAELIAKHEPHHTDSIARDELQLREKEVSFKQCCGSGMFYPGSGSLTFILDPGGEKAPDPGSRIPDPTIHKSRDEK